MNSYQWYNPRTSRGTSQGVHTVDTVTSLSAQLDALTSRLNQISKGKATPETMEEVKSIIADVEQVDFVGTNRPQNNPYINTYNPGWWNHPNFSRKDNNQGQSSFGQQQQFQQRPPQNFQPHQQFQGPNKMSNGMSLEDAVIKLISTTESQALLADSHHKQYEERIEIFIGVPLRPQPASSSTQKAQPSVIQPPTMDLPSKAPPKRTFTSHIPYPGRLVKQKTDEQYEKFIELLSQIHVNIPFLDIIQTMPKYGRFLKDFLTNKRNLKEAIKEQIIESSRVLLVKVGKFVFPADFMVLEMGQDFSVPLIFGRPFLATAKAVIDMNERILTLRIGKQSVTYNIGGYECTSSDPLEISHFIDSNLDYQLQKARDLKKGKAPDLTKPKAPDPMAIDLTKYLDNTNWIDEYFDKLPKLNEEARDTREVVHSHLKKD
ncbi:hypothetical protein L1987_70540 [Smallanthus sonchifolius]|uniref:Uncharacterized protein n=1 Tax=Smallanthus sonchifolius TaxID=185202 RepID=A0ACB9AQI5_9ASTR|nr:hypothetical protein L1987_70540 [Smallanthus sonchifolius]